MAQETTSSSARAKVSDGYIWLYSHYEDRFKAAAIPGALWSPMHTGWRYPATPAIATWIVGVWPETEPALSDLLAQSQARTNANVIKYGAQPDRPDYVHQTDPWPHQVGATYYAVAMDRALLHCVMGAGKTKITLDAAMTLGHRWILVVCPKAVMQVWDDEIVKHAPGQWDVMLLDSRQSVKGRAERLRRAYMHGEPVVVVVNYEASWRKPLSEVLLAREWDLVVLDESHRIKSPGAKQGRFCARFKAKQMLALTGTPMPHSPLDLYGQYRALDPGIFGTSFIRFRARYAVMGGFEHRQVLAFQNQDEMRERMDRLRYEVKSDALTLPPLQVLDRACVLEPATRKVYDELKHEFVAAVKDGVVTASNALVKLLRLQQVAAGFVPDDAGEVQEVGTEKRLLLCDMLDDLRGERVVVFCRFHHDMDVVKRLCEEGKRRFLEISGRENDYKLWKLQEGIVQETVLAVQLQAGLGIDLTEARYGVFYTLGFSLGDYEQCIARLHRPGQEHPTVIYRLLARATVDQKIARALGRRADVIRFILEGIK